jgi:hypothetical protein
VVVRRIAAPLPGPRHVLFLDELTAALAGWIKLWNASARPFRWTKTADQIIDRICRYCSRISGPGH